MALVMVADDNPDIVELLKDFLQGRGHQVVTVTDGLHLAEKAMAWKPQIIIADIQMPNVYGTTAYAVLQKNPDTARIPVIFVTGVPLESARKIVPEAPTVRLLSKPVNMQVLEKTIQDLVPA